MINETKPVEALTEPEAKAELERLAVEIARVSGLDGPVTDERFIELDYGDWDLAHLFDDPARVDALAERLAQQRGEHAGWLLGPDGLPCDPAMRCDHQEAAHA